MNLVTRFVGQLTVTACLAATAASNVVADQLTAQQLLAGAVKKFDAARYGDVERAVSDFYRGETVAARAALQAAQEKQPELPPPDVLLAILEFSFNRRAEAEKSLDQAARKSPNDPEAYLYAAEFALREERPLAAEMGFAYARQALDTYAANPYRRHLMEIRLEAGLASLNEERGDAPNAVKHLQAWLKADPRNPVALGSLGRVQFGTGDYEAARATFSQLEQFGKDAPPADVAMGRLYSDKGMHEEALRAMEAAVAAHEKDPRTLLTVADWAFMAGRSDLAKKHVEAALQQQPTLQGANVLKARMARDAGDIGAAEALLDIAVLAAPADFAASNELARTLALSKDSQKRKIGLEYANRNYRLVTNRATPVGCEATVTLAWLLLSNDRPDEAERVLLTLADGSTVSNENAYLAAQIYAKLDRRDAAVPALRAALAAEAHFPGRAAAEELLATLTAGSR